MYSPFAKYLGKVVGTGECVAFVQAACEAPQTALWKRGAHVKGIPLLPGTAIATFDPPSAEHPNGRYGNYMDGRSHAALYLSQTAIGILVLDQWGGQPVHERVIVFKAGIEGAPVNDGDAFYVVE